MKKLIVLSFIAFVVSCTPKIIESTQTDATKTTTVEDEIAAGKKLYQNTCASCHNLHEPGERDAAGWKAIVPPMSKKAKIDSTTQTKILNYLLANCNK